MIQTVLIILLIILILCFILNIKKRNKEQFNKDKNTKKYGVMWASTFNIGDDFQTLAAINLLKKNNINDYVFVDREKLKEYNGESINLIANGWYMHDTTNFPPSDKITPIFISVYIHKEEIVSNNIAYFKKYEPIGCRDLSTKKLFEKYNIKAYFSGCLTLTFDEHNNKGNKVYIVDPKGSNSGKFFENLNFNLNINENDIEYISHNNYGNISNYKYNINKRLKNANNLLDKYRRAKLVITSRLHAALPCRAFNTDVKFLHSNYYVDKRFSGLREIINGSNKSNIDNIPQKIDRTIINKYKNNIKSKFKELVLNISEIYVINLKKNKDRLNEFMKNANKANVNVKRFDAIYGKELDKDDSDIQKYFIKDHKLNPGQIGCALSHIKIWEEAVKNNYNNIIVFEDDAIIPENFWDKFKEAYNELPNDWDYFSLNCSWCKNIKDYTFIHKSDFNVCTIAYIINLNSINKIFDLIKRKKIDEPIDKYLFENYYKKNNLYVIKPSLVKPNIVYTSDIGVGNGGRI